jgi:hypothetical protein
MALRHGKIARLVLVALAAVAPPLVAAAQAGDPTTLLWYTHPAEKWDDALPVGNGRLGALVFAKTGEEEIPINEDTYWSGGPYSTTVEGGYRALPEIRRLIFDGELVRAHKAFGRHLMGYPVEQQKYQALGSVWLRFPGAGEVTGYRHELDLDTAIATTRFERDGVVHTREARLEAVPEGGSVRVLDDTLVVEGANAVTLLVAAATSFVTYEDVSGDPAARVAAALGRASGRPFEAIRRDHVAEHQRLFRRVSIDLGTSPDEPANLQSLWNPGMNPMWDSKYTTNINTEMNYWPAEVGNLSECAEPLIRMIRELSGQGASVAREHYGARGWVAHQNTDLWRAAAPMDGPSWGAFTTGGAWLVTHLLEHYRFTGDREFLREQYPVMKGAALFFLDFLVPHPRHGWLVTNPSTSPENFPLAPGNDPFFDEVTGCAEVDPAPMAGPPRQVFIPWMLREAPGRAPVDVDRPEVPMAVHALRVESDPAAVRRPIGGSLNQAGSAGELQRVPSVGPGQPDLLRLAGANGLEGDSAAVGREQHSTLEEGRGGREVLARPARDELHDVPVGQHPSEDEPVPRDGGHTRSHSWHLEHLRRATAIEIDTPQVNAGVHAVVDERPPVGRPGDPEARQAVPRELPRRAHRGGIGTQLDDLDIASRTQNAPVACGVGEASPVRRQRGGPVATRRLRACQGTGLASFDGNEPDAGRVGRPLRLGA